MFTECSNWARLCSSCLKKGVYKYTQTRTGSGALRRRTLVGKELLRIPEFGEVIGYKETKVRQFIEKGWIHVVIIEGQMRVPADEAEVFRQRAERGELA